MKVLVTGASGFIGNYVVHELNRAKHSVVVLTTGLEKVEGKDWYDDVTTIVHDIHGASDDDLYVKFGRPDLMIHLAWGALDDFRSNDHLDVVLPSHKKFVSNLIENGLKHVSIIGTCFEYGMQEGELSEEADSQPTMAYPVAKNSLREYCEGLSAEHDFLFHWIRLFYMHGEGQNPKAIIPLLEKALADNEPVFNMSRGEQERDYLHVSDVAKIIVRIALQDKVSGIVNCCSGKPISIKQLVEDHLSKTGKSMELNLGYYPYPDYEPFKFWGSTKKLDSILDAGA